MKREIVCPDCEQELKKQFKSLNPYPGEHLKYVPGTALKDYLCDQCNISIPKGGKAVAFSIWADHGGIPYYKWEHEFLIIN